MSKTLSRVAGRKFPRRVAVWFRLASTNYLVVYERQGSTYQFEVSRCAACASGEVSMLRDLIDSELCKQSVLVVYGLTLYWHWREGELHYALEEAGLRLFSTTATSFPFLATYIAKREIGGKQKSRFVQLIDIECVYPFEAIEGIAEMAKISSRYTNDERDLYICTEFYAYILSYLAQAVDICGGNCYSYTAAGMGMLSFRTKFVANNDISCALEERVASLCYNAVYGGYTEVVQGGQLDGVWYFCDANNLYHHLVSTVPVPGRLISYSEDPTTSMIDYAADTGLGVAEVTLFDNELKLPVRDTRGAIEYRSGYVQTCLAGRDLSLALRKSKCFLVHRLAAFKPSTSLPNYATWCLSLLSELKLGAPKFLYKLVKRILTSTYGKFAQLGRRLVPAENITARGWSCDWYDKDERGILRRFVSLFGKTYVEIDDEVPSHANPAVFAYITAEARDWLRRVCSIIKRGRVVYLDTDCVVTNEEGLRELERAGMIGQEPGQLQVKDVVSNLYIYAPKCYVAGGVNVMAGLRRARRFPGVPESFADLAASEAPGWTHH